MMLVSDYDRTLMIDRKLPQQNREALVAFKKGKHLFVINSGRSYHHLKENMDENKLQCDYTITGSGSQIHDSLGNLLYEKVMEKAHVLWVVEKIVCSECTSFQLSSSTHWHRFSKDKEDCWDLSLVKGLDLSSINTLAARFASETNAEQFAHILNQNPHVAAYSNRFSVDIVDAKISKATGIKELVSLLNYHDPVHVIGDSFNDYQMIQDFNGYCVAVSDARIQKIAQKQYKDVAACIYDIMK